MHAKYSTGFEITEMNARHVCCAYTPMSKVTTKKKIPYVMECLLAYQRA